jgi:hypothetical protein
MSVTRGNGGQRRSAALISGSRRLNRATVAALVVLLALSAVASWGTHTIVRDQERRLLKERSAEVSLVFTVAISSIRTNLTSDLGVLVATNGAPSAFTRAATPDVLLNKRSHATVALLTPAGAGSYKVVTAVGPLFKPGQVVTGVQAQTLAKARTAKDLVTTPLIGTGKARVLGFAINAPGIRSLPGAVLYRQTVLGPLAAPRQAATPNKDPKQLLTSSTGGALPAEGASFVSQPVGASRWLLGLRPKSSLVGGVASNAWWIVLVGGIAGSLLMAAVVEFAIRRRDAALSLYAIEHQQAETLQRSLLPSLPRLPGLDLAARYQAGGVGQQVGGDWFDAFPLDNGGVGFAIGDVIGHDLEAAAAMSQVRAALRAYAYEGDEPERVIQRLDRLVTTSELTQLVSVIYGVLGPMAEDGSRLVRFANAGHLPPLLQDPEGQVAVLSDGASVVIGAPCSDPRTQAELLLRPDSTLLLFTDGLLEAPNLSLSETIPRLAETVSEHAPSEGSDALCDRVLASRINLSQRDDIALLAVRLLQAPAKSPLPRKGGESEESEAQGTETTEDLSTAPLPAQR